MKAPIKITVYPIPININLVDNNDKIVLPAIQAFYNSPNWQPVPTKDGVIYIWNSGEAVYDPETKQLFVVTRTGKKLLLFRGVQGIPGGRLNNVFDPDWLGNDEELLWFSQVDKEVAILAFLIPQLMPVKFVVAWPAEVGKFYNTVEFRWPANEMLVNNIRVKATLTEKWNYPVIELEIYCDVCQGREPDEKTKKWFNEKIREILPHWLIKKVGDQLSEDNN